MLMMSKLSVSSSLSAQSSSLLLRRVGRKIAARSRKSSTFYQTGKAFASSEEGGEGKEEEEWAAMGSNAKSNVVPRKPTKLAGTNAPEYMHGVLAFNRFYPENARGDTFNRHLLVALVIFFSVLDTFLCVFIALFFSWTSTKTTTQSSAMMEEKIECYLQYDIRRYMITELPGSTEPKLREREERSFSHFFLLIRRFDSRARSAAI